MNRSVNITLLKCLTLCLLATALFFSGCVTTPDPREEEAVFFPDPPSPPRLQFLRSYTTSKDIEKGASAFDSFLTGATDRGIHLIKPYGVAIEDGKIYVCDSQVTVEVFDLKAKDFYQMKGARGLGKLLQPLNITIDDAGNRFVADPVRGEVVMYDAGDSYVRSYGGGYKWKPVDLATLEGLLYVVDSENREVKVFDIETGETIRALGRSNKPEENLGLPTNINIGADKRLYITDSGRFQVVIYDRDGHQLDTIGKPGANLGHFARPRGIALDQKGLVYVVDAAFENVQIFKPDGQLLLFFGGSGRGPGNLFLPADVIIDYDHIEYFQQYADPSFEIDYLVIVTSQFGERLINVYGYGKEKGRTYPAEETLVEKAEKKLEKWLEESK